MNTPDLWIHPISLPEIAPPRTQTVDGNLYSVYRSRWRPEQPDALLLTRYQGTEESFILPDRVGYMRVIAIGAGAVSNARNLRSFSVPSGCVCVGDHAFFQCTQLTDVILPDTLQSIGTYAFAGCRSLQSIRVPSTIRQIGKDAFQGCKDLVIQGEAGSVAHRYADAHGIPFTATDTG